MQQALTNALLMDAVVGSLQSSKAIYAASKLAHFDRIKMEGRMIHLYSLSTIFSAFLPNMVVVGPWGCWVVTFKILRCIENVGFFGVGSLQVGLCAVGTVPVYGELSFFNCCLCVSSANEGSQGNLRNTETQN